MPRPRLEWDGECILIVEGDVLLGRFYPYFALDSEELPEEELSEEELAELIEERGVLGGVLEVVAIGFPRHFVQDLFEEGDGLDKLEEALQHYLEAVRRWRAFCDENPNVTVMADGFIDFIAHIHLNFNREVSSLGELKEELMRWLDKLPYAE